MKWKVLFKKFIAYFNIRDIFKYSWKNKTEIKTISFAEKKQKVDWATGTLSEFRPIHPKLQFRQ